MWYKYVVPAPIKVLLPIHISTLHQPNSTMFKKLTYILLLYYKKLNIKQLSMKC